MALCNITGTLYYPSGEPARTRQVWFHRNPESVAADYLGTVLPDDTRTRSAYDGSVDFNLITGRYIGEYVGTHGRVTFKLTVPEAASARLEDCIAAVDPVEPMPMWLVQIIAEREAAEDAAAVAEDEADRAEAAAADAVNNAPWNVKDYAAFAALPSLVVGARYRAPGMAWDVLPVDAVDYDFIHDSGALVKVVPDGPFADIRAFGCKLDGVTDDTLSFQAALDSGLVLLGPEGELLLTDTILLDPGFAFAGAGGVAEYTNSRTRIRFEPATKRDIFRWRTEPTDIVLAGGLLTGFCIRGFGPGADACLDLPKIYNGTFNFFAYAGVDHWMRIGQWMDTSVKGGVQGFRESGIVFYNGSSGDPGGVTTTTDFDVYVSQGPLAVDAGDTSVTSTTGRFIIESVDCALDMARGNTLYARFYTENVPRTDEEGGAVFRVGKRGTGPIYQTNLFAELGPCIGYTGGFPENTVLLDVGLAENIRLSGYTYSHGALVIAVDVTSAKLIDFSGLAVDNCPYFTLGLWDLLPPLVYSNIAPSMMNKSPSELMPPPTTKLQTVEQSYRTYSADPYGVFVPIFVGEEVLNLATGVWSKSTGVNPSDWRPLGQSHREYGASPVGAVVPRYVGEDVLDTVAGDWYKSTGTAMTDWKKLT